MARAKKAAPIEEGDTEETAVKKVSPKSAKKSAEPVAPKSSKKSKPAAEDDGASDSSESMVTLASLCESRDLNPRDARIRLRRKLERAEGARWAWAEDSDELDTVNEILDDMVEGKAKRAEAAEEDEAPAPKAKAKAKAKGKAKGRAKAKPDPEEDDDYEDDED